MKYFLILSLLGAATAPAQTTAAKTSSATLGQILTGEGVTVEARAKLVVDDDGGAYAKLPMGGFELNRRIFKGVKAGFYKDGDGVFLRFGNTVTHKQTPNGPFNLVAFSGAAPAQVTISYDVRFPEALKGEGNFTARPFFHPDAQHPNDMPNGLSNKGTSFKSDAKVGEWITVTETYPVPAGTTQIGLVPMFDRVTGDAEISNIKITAK